MPVMRDHPEYDLVEFLLCGLFIAASGVSLVWAGASFYRGEPFSALEGAGLGLMFLGGGASPKHYLLDCLTFPLSFIEGTGRETPTTVLAAGAGLLLWLAGLAGNHWG